MAHTEFNKLNPKELFRFAVIIVVVSILIVGMLNKAETIQLAIEKDTVKAEVQSIRLVLAQKWVNQNITHKKTNVSALKSSNPMLLMSYAPKNYVGEYATTPSDAVSIWFYNTRLKQLVYILRNKEALYFNLSNTRNGQINTRYPSGGLDLVMVSK